MTNYRVVVVGKIEALPNGEPSIIGWTFHEDPGAPGYSANELKRMAEEAEKTAQCSDRRIMNWEATVLKDNDKADHDLLEHNLSSLFSYRQAYFVGCIAQAEPSYKAGYEKAKQESNVICHLDIYKAGMKKVVEWIQNTKCFNHVGGVVSVDFMPGEWEAFLKDNGLDKGP